MDILTGLGFAREVVMGPVTKFIASQDVGFFTALSLLFESYIFTLLPIPLLFFYKHINRKKIASLVLSLFFMYILVTSLKSIFQQSRPCNEYLKMDCPLDYSFPSGHTTVAFAFVFFSLGTMAFPFYYISAFLIAISRIYLGIHSLNDVVGGVVVGMFSYFISEKVVEACLRYVGG